MKEVMIEVQKILDNGHMIETKEGILQSHADPGLTFIQGGYKKTKWQ